ncbi:Rib/alpha-like domain-containing protein, partial [Staphylococcus simulans]|uniref:Rib/alpha-like domain-containing protein n=1 Tax=Staphylococcus simulans TaxID=1286 RepID=UPI002279A91E
EEVKGKVSVPNFPKTGAQPTLTVDTTKIPNGQTPGTVKVSVTVTYPDKTTDTVEVTVITGPKDSETYEPTTGEITKPFGTPTTAEEVKGKVSIPNFPANGPQPTLTVDNTKVPNGQTSGEFNVPVTVTYPDGTTDQVNVKVTVGKQPDKDKYNPVGGTIEKPFGTPTSADEVKGKVTVPGFPKEGPQPTVTVDKPNELPNGETTGVFNVPVTVTYPDGTSEKTNVKVAVGKQADNAKYEPTTGEIEKPYGGHTTVNEVIGKVSVPDYPASGEQPVFTVDTTKIPDGQTSGEFQVPVTVTYPDKTTDTVNVKVTVGPKDSDTYQPVAGEITKPFGTPTVKDEVLNKVSVPNYPGGEKQPVPSLEKGAVLPDGNTPGVFDVPVVVTYPDGTTDKVVVKVTVGDQADNAKYEPTAGEITKPFGTPTTVDEVKGKVTVPNYPANGQPYTAIVDPTKVPDGQTSGEFQVPVTVTYPDKTTDTVNVKVTVGPKDSDTYQPVTGEIAKPFGQATTPEEVKAKVSVPNYPTDKGTPVVTVDEPNNVPNGETPGVFDVPVTV